MNDRLTFESEGLLFTHRQQLDSISVFQKCSHEAVQSIITNLKMEIYLRGLRSHLWKCWRYLFLAYIWSMRYFEQERGENWNAQG